MIALLAVSGFNVMISNAFVPNLWEKTSFRHVYIGLVALP